MVPHDTPHDKLCAAIGILQSHYVASDSVLDAEAIFGACHLPTSEMEHAIHLLIEVLPELERLEAMDRPTSAA